MYGPDALRIVLRGATPTGGDYQGGQHPGPTRPGRRRLGLPVSRQGQSSLATATGTPPQRDPGPQLEGPSEALSTFPTTRGTRQTPQGGHRGHGPCAGRLHVGHGHGGARQRVRPRRLLIAHTTQKRSTRQGLPTCLGRDAAPVWCHPRRREEACTGDSSLEGGRHPTDPRTVVPNPRIAAGATVVSDWLRLFRWTPSRNRNV
jgi:hypothetical protein